MHFQFAHQIGTVFLDRLDRDQQALRNVFIATTPEDQVQHFALAVG
jgi:hypothetical protein